MDSPDIVEGPIKGFVNRIKKFIILKWRGISALPKILLTA
jgi:hypothetical protein